MDPESQLSAINRHQAWAEKAAPLWCDQSIPTHIRDSGNSVYFLETPTGKTILRLTHPDFRTGEETLAELEFLLYLYERGINVARPLISRAGKLVEEVEHQGKTLLAAQFSWAEGEVVLRDSPHWGEDMFVQWGRTLGQIHRAASEYQPSGTARRWHWDREILFVRADELLPVDDGEVRNHMAEIFDHLESLPRSPQHYGLTHADFAPQNFHYHPKLGLTGFDFGNCCYHWYLSDLAISLSTLRSQPHRDQFARWILQGYGREFSIDKELWENIEWFFRLRFLYVYLSRCYKFSPSPTPSQQTRLHQLRQIVLEPFDWKIPTN